MKQRWVVTLTLAAMMTASVTYAGEVQWARVTVLLESGTGQIQRYGESLIPGGIYSLDEVERRGIEAVDTEIVERVRLLAGEMEDAQESMRLGDLRPRQYYLPLEVGRQAVLPVIDLNPRLGIVLTPQRFEVGHVVCTVKFLEPQGVPGAIEYRGEPISLRLQDADLQKVIKTFAMVATKEIIVDESVAGKVTVDLQDIPWDQALDVVLRTNNLGWERDGDALRVVPLDDLSQQRRVRTQATLELPRGRSGATTVASKGDEQSRTVLLVIESVDREPELVAERDGLLRPPPISMTAPSQQTPVSDLGSLVIFRGTATEQGNLDNVEILDSPFAEEREDLVQALRSVRWTVLDKQVRRIDAVVGYGIRMKSASSAPPGLVPIQAVERIGVDVEAEPVGSAHPGQYIVSVVVKNLETGSIISAPRVTAEVGQEATITSELTGRQGTPTSFEMKLTIQDDKRSVSYSWSLTEEGKVISTNSANLKL